MEDPKCTISFMPLSRAVLEPVVEEESSSIRSEKAVFVNVSVWTRIFDRQ